MNGSFSRRDWSCDRRGFVRVLGAGLLFAAVPVGLEGQGTGGRRGGGARTVAARLHIGEDGRVTVLSGKIEMGQGARAEIAQAVAEELRVPVEAVAVVLGDTGAVPDDGLSAGSRTTPGTIPAVRQAAAAARDVLVGLAGQRWGVERTAIEARGGAVVHAGSGRQFTYAELARSEAAVQAFAGPVPAGVTVTPVREWRVLGTSVARPNARDLLTGAHRYPSDVVRPGQWRGRVLRPPAYRATLAAVDLGPAQAMPDVTVVREGGFVGVAAPTEFQARAALAAVARTARWEAAPHPSSGELFDHLRGQVRNAAALKNPFEAELGRAAKARRETYEVAYIQHAPLETRSAVAEWREGRLTVWTGTQNPFGYHGELMRAFGLAGDQVRVVVDDFGGGFGGKHTAECAIEAARLARAAGRPVVLKWTREEEFTWAYFRPAAVIQIEAGLDAQGGIAVWHFVNINSGGSAVETPYRVRQGRSRYVESDPPLRQGSYRTLAATANTFARESFMDELAHDAGADPLDFRLKHLDQPRLRAVLEAAARRFDWRQRLKSRPPDTGYGLACGTEKGSYVAACVEVDVDRERKAYTVRRVCEVFECGAVLNPANLLAQVQGCIVMGLGAVLREEMQFAEGRMLNASFEKYLVPRFKDVPELDIELLARPDLDPAGGGETPIIAVAPAVANAVFQATGQRIRRLPVRLAN